MGRHDRVVLQELRLRLERRMAEIQKGAGIFLMIPLALDLPAGSEKCAQDIIPNSCSACSAKHIIATSHARG